VVPTKDKQAIGVWSAPDATCSEDSFAPQCCCCSMNALLPALDEGQNVNDHFELQFNPNTNI